MPGWSPYSFAFNNPVSYPDYKGLYPILTVTNQITGYTIYDPRLGRFLSTDPLTQQYPWYTPYQFAGNTPIQAIDVDGLEAAVTTFYYATQKDAKVKIINSNIVVDNTKPRSETFMININGRNYTANSYYTLEGRDDRQRFNGDFSGQFKNFVGCIFPGPQSGSI